MATQSIMDTSPQRRRLLGLMGSTVALAACGGGGGDPGTGQPPPPPPPDPPVHGPAWRGFGGDAQHRAQAAIATQDLTRIVWRTPVDTAPPYTASGALLAHYGSPLCTSKNTVLVPVRNAGGFVLEARSGGNGVLMWQLASDHRPAPGFNWVPSWNPALDASNRVFAPAAGGRLIVRDDADTLNLSPRRVAFFGDAAYALNPQAFDDTVYINTPLTVDADGNVFFGFAVTGTNPAGLVSGIARLAPDGSARWVGAAAAAGDSAIAKVATNCAPALSPDGRTLYLVVNIARGSGVQRGRLLALDASTLATKAAVPLLEPGTGLNARISDDDTSSPTLGPDGDVYQGVLEPSFGTHNGRGWLLHFDATLAQTKIPGSFGWDDTVSVLPASAVPGYTGASAYLLMSKYNNYYGIGTGDGINRIAVLDPFVSQNDSISGRPVMREVLAIAGPTPEGGGSPGVKEWCINTAVVDPARRSVLANSEDGWLYRWDLASNSFTQKVQLTSGIAESYTPTAVGADGKVYAINNAVLFAIGA